MSQSSLESLKIKAKLLQKAKQKSDPDFALKDAYQILASQAGYPDWKSMKDSLELSDTLNPPRWSAQWKVWYPEYAQALAHVKSAGGYLLPYRNQFFVADENYINALGISVEDVDLTLVGNDWCKPKDKNAWERLLKKIRANH